MKNNNDEYFEGFVEESNFKMNQEQQSKEIAYQKEFPSSPETMPATQSDSLLAMIERLAMSPEIDISKFEKMLDLQERVIDKASAMAYSAAMAHCQAEMPSVVKQGYNNHTESKYAKFENILEQTKPVYTKYGFALSFGTDISPIENHVRVTCDISHKEGHSKHFFQDLPIDNAGIGGKTNKTAMHGTASTFTYGRRYLFTMIFNIAVKDFDNDGNKQPVQVISKVQVDELKIMISATNSNEMMFCSVCKVPSLEEMPVEKFDKAMQLLKTKHSKQPAKPIQEQTNDEWLAGTPSN